MTTTNKKISSSSSTISGGRYYDNIHTSKPTTYQYEHIVIQPNHDNDDRNDEDNQGEGGETTTLPFFFASSSANSNSSYLAMKHNNKNKKKKSLIMALTTIIGIGILMGAIGFLQNHSNDSSSSSPYFTTEQQKSIIDGGDTTSMMKVRMRDSFSPILGGGPSHHHQVPAPTDPDHKNDTPPPPPPPPLSASEEVKKDHDDDPNPEDEDKSPLPDPAEEEDHHHHGEDDDEPKHKKEHNLMPLDKKHHHEDKDEPQPPPSSPDNDVIEHKHDRHDHEHVHEHKHHHHHDDIKEDWHDYFPPIFWSSDDTNDEEDDSLPPQPPSDPDDHNTMEHEHEHKDHKHKHKHHHHHDINEDWHDYIPPIFWNDDDDDSPPLVPPPSSPEDWWHKHKNMIPPPFWSDTDTDTDSDENEDDDDTPPKQHDHPHPHDHSDHLPIPPMWSDDSADSPDSVDSNEEDQGPPPSKTDPKRKGPLPPPKKGQQPPPPPPTVPVPYGVNFGSWLALEDYFYVGSTGAIEVATPEGYTSAICLPPLHTGQLPAWHSETDLLKSLMTIKTTSTTTTTNGKTTTSGGSSLAHALKVFHAHRTSFITSNDLETLASWGVQHVRIPISWCFTDASFEAIDLQNTTKPYEDYLLETYTCADPFYADKDVLWPAIPKQLLQDFLRDCSFFGITASLDLHTYPGATSPGTFSGLWPLPPRFWYHDTNTTTTAMTPPPPPTSPNSSHPTAPLLGGEDQDPIPLPPPPPARTDLGRTLYRDFIAWVEELADTDPEAFDGILGISPMNEPAHLAGIFKDTERDYLPPLPPDMAQDYLNNQLNNNPNILDGPHLRVLLWLDDAIETFRRSSLPSKGKQLHVNVHESVLSPSVSGNDDNDSGGRHPDATNLIAAWWSEVTTPQERSSWVVLDMHHYHAWEPACQGSSDGPPVANYTCTNKVARDDALKRCTSWATDTFRGLINQHCEPTARLMSGEFSTSTHHSVKHACSDVGTIKASYLAQMEAAHNGDVKLYYWSYKMPHGGAAKNAWSFSHLMYLLGINPHPDVDNYNCGGHIPHENEVTDDWF